MFIILRFKTSILILLVKVEFGFIIKVVKMKRHIKHTLKQILKLEKYTLAEQVAMGHLKKLFQGEIRSII